MSAPDFTTPAVRACHAINNARQIAVALRMHADTLDEGNRIEELLAPVIADIEAMQHYIDRQEDNIRTMNQEALETHRELTAERAKSDGALAALRAFPHTYAGAR